MNFIAICFDKIEGLVRIEIRAAAASMRLRAGDNLMSIVFKRLSEVDKPSLIALMNDPLVRRHMPLARGDFGPDECDSFIAAKEKLWEDYGYGPWAFVLDGVLVGWGGLQLEGEDVDLALVLHPKHWGLGKALYKEIISIAFGEMGFESVTVLLPPTRRRVGGMSALGFRRDGEVEVSGERFIRYRLNAPDTSRNPSHR